MAIQKKNGGYFLKLEVEDHDEGTNRPIKQLINIVVKIVWIFLLNNFLLSQN